MKSVSLSSSIYFLNTSNSRSKTYATLLSQEIYSRIFIKLDIHELKTFEEPSNEEKTSINKIILLSREDKKASEGYKIKIRGDNIIVEGESERGLLFGVGRLLRELYLNIEQEYEKQTKQIISITEDLNIDSAPLYPLRGHQIAYRPKTNTYDAFDLKQMQQEIIDCAIWGCNTIEIIPPGLDDFQQSPHFQLSWIEMIRETSIFCDLLDLDVSIWYPAYFENYSDESTMKKAEAHWHSIFGSLKRLNKLFVPGGDPGGRDPKQLFLVIAIQAEFMKKNYFPKAEVWVSSQFGLSVSTELNLKPWNPREYEDHFFLCLKDCAGFISGVVYGPWSAYPIDEYRKRVPECYPLRNYPDLCHSLKCEFPVQDWDLTYAMTQNRECINPRPQSFLRIMKDQAPLTIGCGCYSEGVNDDVNKVIWSSFHWGNDKNGPLKFNKEEDLVRKSLEQYGKTFFKPQIADLITQLIYLLERNWQEDPSEGPSLHETWIVCSKIEKLVSTRDYRNWRLSLILFRAYHDLFLGLKRREELELENRVLGDFENYQNINRALEILENTSYAKTNMVNSYINLEWPGKENNKAYEGINKFPSILALTGRLNSLAGALYQGIGLQLSVTWHGGENTERGAFFDMTWIPQSNIAYIYNTFKTYSNDIGKVNELLSQLTQKDYLYYYSFGDSSSKNQSNEPLSIQDNLSLPFSKRRVLGEDPTYFSTGLIDHADTNSAEIISLIVSGKVLRSWLSWLTSIWATQPFLEILIPLSKIKITKPELQPQNYVLEVTYIGRDLWLEGGDWMVFGRDIEPTRMIVNGIEVHGWRGMEEKTRRERWDIGMVGEDGVRVRWEARKAENVTIRTPMLPIVEIAVLKG